MTLPSNSEFSLHFSDGKIKHVTHTYTVICSDEQLIVYGTDNDIAKYTDAYLEKILTVTDGLCYSASDNSLVEVVIINRTTESPDVYTIFEYNLLHRVFEAEISLFVGSPENVYEYVGLHDEFHKQSDFINRNGYACLSGRDKQKMVCIRKIDYDRIRYN